MSVVQEVPRESVDLLARTARVGNELLIPRESESRALGRWILDEAGPPTRDRMKERNAEELAGEEVNESPVATPTPLGVKKAAFKISKSTGKKVEKSVKSAAGPAIQKPTRAKTAYLLFCAAHRARVKESQEQSGKSMVEITKVLGEAWKNGDAAEKEKFEALAAKERERHDKEMEVYLDKLRNFSDPNFTIEKGMTFPAQMLALRKPTIPKTAVALFTIACKKEWKKQGKVFAANEAKTLAHQEWLKTGEEERQKYFDLAEDARKAYEEKMADYNNKKKQQNMGILAETLVPGTEEEEGADAQAVAQVEAAEAEAEAGAVAEEAEPVPMATETAAPGAPPVDGNLDPTNLYNLFDMEKLKKATKKLASEDTYYELIDSFRNESPNYQKAMSACHAHIIGQGKPDYKAFLVQLFGMGVLKK